MTIQNLEKPLLIWYISLRVVNKRRKARLIYRSDRRGTNGCADCACTRTLNPQGEVLQLKAHDKRKTSTPNTGPRWAKVETDWDVIGK
ncbi:hypothetical protein KSD_59640 [Ktedonobacter sp. SOSP1-85]|uniref:hypothetical protein n=1 Tax=Ktedonobacter sp. SOSP1-85 TaxID=2778367 RepID=UPI00191614A2|nr:hypothetical protein [Ktedonobacter sp. SOSP1-85]GHO78193.1 hypothetical protein KSD_59640 [Ktedonobacter sp. SOSP1-85]